jgi:transcriptional regulator with XRE-family HTH domain
LKTVAELVNDLFRTHTKPDGREYSNREVARALKGQISADYLSKLRRGEVPNPGRNTLLLLCQYFTVSPTYFFPEWNAPTSQEVDESTAVLERRIAELSPEARAQLAKLLDMLKDRRG